MRLSGRTKRTHWIGHNPIPSIVLAVFLPSFSVLCEYPTNSQIAKGDIAIVVEDVAEVPLSSRTTTTYPPLINYGNQLTRINFLRCEPLRLEDAPQRFFLCDLNRELYIGDSKLTNFTPYINFEEVFVRFDNNPGYAGGLVTFAFDPDYAHNGRFYTVHTEDPEKSGPAEPQLQALPGLELGGGYETTTAVNPPYGTVTRESVLVEWTDSNPADSMFQGSARELLRIGFNGVIHPMGDLLFNPAARLGDGDYGNLYVANGDGSAGEQTDDRHAIPQMLSALQGKILRITPDINLRPDDLVSSNGRYRIPSSELNRNPFVHLNDPDVRSEIFAYGFRNPHRLSWDQLSDTLIATDIGLSSWEEIDVVHGGENYGYAEREGTELLFVGGSNNGLTGGQIEPPEEVPADDTLDVVGLSEPQTPVYPVAAYSHLDGDAICGGFVYRGKRVPALRGKFIFGDITTGRIFAADFAAMQAADDSVRETVAPIDELRIVYDGTERRLFDVIADAYARRGGHSSSGVLPGGCGGLLTGGTDSDGVPYGCGRADIRLAEDDEGEIYILSKSDGVIRRITSTAVPPQTSVSFHDSESMIIDWPSTRNRSYQIESRSLVDPEPWSIWKILDPVDASNISVSILIEPGARIFRVVTGP